MCPVRSMATRSGTLARIRLRAAVRRQSWRKRVGTPAHGRSPGGYRAMRYWMNVTSATINAAELQTATII